SPGAAAAAAREEAALALCEGQASGGRVPAHAVLGDALPPVSSCWKLGISSTALEYFIFTLLGKGTPLARFHDLDIRPGCTLDGDVAARRHKGSKNNAADTAAEVLAREFPRKPSAGLLQRRIRMHYGPVSYHMQRLESVLVGLFRQPPEAPEAPSLSAARLNPAVKPDIWSLNGTLINLSLDRRRRLSGGNLIISSLDRYQDVGQYQCMAYNTVGAILSRRASLQFAFLDHFKVHTRSGVSVREGQGVVLLCGTPTSSGDLTYAWIFNEYPYFVQQDNRRFVSQRTGNLYIAKVEPSDVGNYTCVVMNSVTKGKVQSSPTSLILRPGVCLDSGSFHGPRWRMEPGDLFIPMESIEEEATLSCDAKGIPPPQYRDDLSDDLAAVYFARIHYGRRCSVARERRLRGPQHYGPVSYHMQRLESVALGLFRQPPEAPEAPSLSAARLNPAVKPDMCF
ncbi:LOW QUALITY PROTEIN: hypothetical protein CRUP_024474, partial [Coryphaenoides rupestris]